MAQGLGGILGGMFGMGQPAPLAQQQPSNPMQGMGLLGRLQYLQQNNPEALIALGSGMMQGNMAGGFAAAGDQMAQHRERAMEQQERQRTTNLTKQWLMTNKGMDEAQAEMAMSNPAILGQVLKGGDTTEFQERAQAAQQYGLDPNSDEGRNFILSGKMPDARGGAAEVGLQAQYGVDANGNPVIIQLGKDAIARQAQMPEGVTLAKEPIKLDAGTHFVLLDPITRQPVGQIEKNLAGAEQQKKYGQAQGEAAFDIPRIEQNAEQSLALIDQLKSHPGRQGSTGFFQGRLPAYSGATQDFQVLLGQAKGKTFLEAYQTLKGGGQITEVEGAKAEAAIARLDRAQSDEAFMQALADFEEVIRKGLTRARRQAGMLSPVPAQGGGQRLRFNPATGELE